MKWIKYLFNGAEVEMGWNEKNEALARREADGEINIYDDGVEEGSALTTEQRLTEMEEALGLLLSGVTE